MSIKTITYKGETRTVAEWSKLKNIKECTIYARLKANMTSEEIFETPVRARQYDRRFNPSNNNWNLILDLEK